MQRLDHLVLLCDVLLYPVEVVRGASVVLFQQVVDCVFTFFGVGQDVLHCVCYDEVFVRFEAVHWRLR